METRKKQPPKLVSMDWFKGKFTGNHRFPYEIWGFPVIFPLNPTYGFK
jgi:hypothetical protein